MSAQVREMRTSWLVQRLTRASHGFGAFGKDNPFSFGGGMRNGGLSDEAMGLLRDIFSFDYMGAAEFEFGAVPEALNRLAQSAGLLGARQVDIGLATVPQYWNTKKKAKGQGVAAVYVLAPTAWLEEVEDRIRGWATGDERLKEATRLPLALRPEEDWHSDVAGWLELSNGFFFFVDHEMWAKTCSLFGVEVPA